MKQGRLKQYIFQKGTNQKHQNLKKEDQQMKWQIKIITYLGTSIDEKLKFNDHIKLLLNKTNKKSNTQPYTYPQI